MGRGKLLLLLFCNREHVIPKKYVFKKRQEETGGNKAILFFWAAFLFLSSPFHNDQT